MAPGTLVRLLAVVALGSVPLSAQATLGVFEHGNGIKSMGIGGVGYSFAEETTVLGANPAHALSLGHRMDLGVDMFWPEAEAAYTGNALGPDEGYLSNGRKFYYIPQGGYSRPLGERWALGITVLSAGLGPDYIDSPYERFGGAPRVAMNLASSGVVTALAYQATPNHAFGFSLNTGYQVLSANGLEFLDNPQVSARPGKVTNQGKDGAFTLGFSVGWYGRLTPWLAAGMAYRSKNWSQRHEEYAGLGAEGGRLELPAIYGGGITLTPAPKWTVALEFQRYEYSHEKAIGNRVGLLQTGNLLGSDNGPGFGFGDQNAYKLGIGWQATPKLMLRAGYVYATVIVRPSETLFAVLGCLTTSNQYSAGATYQLDGGWEISGFAFNVPKRAVQGRDSIPEAFGGGEIGVSDLVYGAGFSVGKRFGSN